MSKLPTIETITSRYLFGSDIPPEDLTSSSIINKDSRKKNEFTVNVNDFMQGPGLFVSPSDFGFIKQFFNDKRFTLKEGETQKVYSKEELFSLLGITDLDDKVVSKTLGWYKKDNETLDEFIERAYVWNTTAFQLYDYPGEDTTKKVQFIVKKENGKEKRYIENFAIIPFMNSKEDRLIGQKPREEDFDFSGGFSSQLVNRGLKRQIDPSGIGRTVYIFFDKTNLTTTTLTYEKYKELEKNAITSSAFNALEIANNLDRIIERLWNSGVIKFLNGDKPIIYGTKEADEIKGTVTTTGVDIKNSLSGSIGTPVMIHKRLLNDYVKNGITYVTGDGDDIITGTEYDDIFLGGKGNDTMEGGEGHDIYYIGGNDTVIDEDGKGEIRFLDKDYKIKPEELSDSVSARRLSELQGWITSYNPSDSSAVFESLDSNNEITHRFEAKGIKLLDSSKTKKDWYGFYDPIVISDFSAESLIITELATGHQVTIKDFVNLQLGITLIDSLLVDLYASVFGYYYSTGENLFEFLQPNRGSQLPHNDDWGGQDHGDSRSQGSDLTSPDGSNPGNNEGGSDNPTGSNPNNPGRHYDLYDPLSLDLDGDGIETVALNGRQGALFDHDNDGIRTATGWLSADDGFLVLDRNHDGVINHAGELFSDNIPLSDSTRSAHGFAALADLDENKDGAIDQNDLLFSELQIWRDLNQNGVSEQNELFSLQSLGIKSLHTAYENRKDTLTGNNWLTQLGQYEKQDGTFGAMADVNFSFNPFYSQFTDALNLTAEQKRIANLTGVGRVRDLREAASLSDELTDLLQRYTAADTRQAQLALLPTILDKWATTDKNYQRYDKSLQKTVESTESNASVIRLTPSQLNNLRNAKHDPVVMERFEQNKAKISTLNSLYGLNIDQLYYTTDKDIDYITDKVNRMYQNTIELAYRSLLRQTRLKKYFYSLRVKQINEQSVVDYSHTLHLFRTTFQKSPLDGLTDLSEYISLLKAPTEWIDGLLLLAEYIGYAKEHNLYEQWQSESSYVISKLNELGLAFPKEGGSINGNEKATILIGSSQDDVLKAKGTNDVLIGWGGNDTLEGGLGSDTYIFSKGHGQDIIQESYHWQHTNDKDTIRFTDVDYSEVKFRRIENDLVMFGYHGEDSLKIKEFYTSADYHVENFEFVDRNLTLEQIKEEGMKLFGTEGNDEINDWNGRSVIDGGAGDDHIRANNGNDTLIGGLGNDTLEGGLGSDTYIFSKGHGQDIIQESYHWQHANDKDTIRFTDITNPKELWFSRNGNNLVIKELTGSDTITVNNWYLNGDYKVENIKLANDSTLGIAQVEKLVSAMAEFEQEHGGDIMQVSQEDVKTYMDKLAVSSYWS